MSDQAPFIPPVPDGDPMPPAPWRVFRVPGFLPLFGAQFVSSLGDWTGLFAIIAIADRVSNSASAVGFVMVARMLPGFLFAPVGGALIDRWNRKAVMVTCDIGRAALLAVLPFWESIWGLVILSFAIEMLTLLWGPAKDASVPNIVKEPEHLASANSLGLVAAFGTFPLGAVMFAALAAIAHWLGGFSALEPLGVKQESLAIWLDGTSFLVSALLISRLRLPETERSARPRVPAAQTWRDIKDGLGFIRSNPLVRGVMIGLAGGLVGGGAIVPLGPTVAKDVLHGGPASFGLLMTALGVGAAVGVVTLLWLQRRLPRQAVFTTGIVATGASIILVASMSSLGPAFVLVAILGAGAGCGYVTGFTMLQESVSDDMRGRTFATLYTIVRVCLLLSLTIAPFVAGALNALSQHTLDGTAHIGNLAIALPGVRLALWLGGGITVLSGLAAQRRMRRPPPAETGASFIVVEGGEGVGKSTQVDLLVERLEATGRAVDKTREPGGTQKGADLRQRLLHDPRGVDPDEELELMLEDRRMHIEERIAPNLARGMVVVSDRFTPSTLAYQGVARGLGLEKVEARCKAVTGNVEPDVVVVLDLPDDIAEARITGARDRFERAGTEFHARVRAAYRTLAPDRGWVIVDASGSPEEVADRVWAAVAPAL